MKYVVAAAAAVVLSSIPLAGEQAATIDQQIAEATKILPEDLRAGATVVTYDAATGARKVLRQGTNFIECQPRMADGFERCYSKSLVLRRDFEAKLRAQKKTDEEIQQAVAAAVKSGALPAPAKAMMSYRGFDKSDRIQNLWVMSVPNATPESVGVSTASQRDDAIAGRGLPWMMLPGTPGAHIMIPINPPVTHSTVTDVAADEITQATLPLPEDLRAGATVYKYDPKTGERVVLRKGTNFVECTPRGADGFTWCYNQSTASRRDFTAKLRAQGKSDKDITDAVNEAVKVGKVKSTPFATMSYRLVRQEGSDPAALGAVSPGCDTGNDWCLGGQSARRGDRWRWAAVADARRHARCAHHDSDQQVVEDKKGPGPKTRPTYASDVGRVFRPASLVGFELDSAHDAGRHVVQPRTDERRDEPEAAVKERQDDHGADAEDHSAEAAASLSETRHRHQREKPTEHEPDDDVQRAHDLCERDGADTLDHHPQPPGV